MSQNYWKLDFFASYRHPYGPDGPGPLLVLIAAFLIISSSINWNLTG